MSHAVDAYKEVVKARLKLERAEWWLGFSLFHGDVDMKDYHERTKEIDAAVQEVREKAKSGNLAASTVRGYYASAIRYAGNRRDQ